MNNESLHEESELKYTRRDYSLVSIISNNPDLSKVLAKKVQEVKKDKQSLVDAAESFSKANKEEILEGTRKKSLLLTDGARKGLKEEDVMKDYGKFIPTVHTPILNLLYFILRESKEDSARVQKFCHELNRQSGHMDIELSDIDDVSLLVENYNKQYGHLKDDESLSDNIEVIPEMEKYLFENCTYDVFCKIKKLKKMMESPFEDEANSAYKKCREMCDKHKLDFDKIR